MTSPEELLAAARHAQRQVEEGREAIERRDEAIGRLYDSDGWSYARIARELGLSTPRVQQIVEEYHERRRLGDQP